MSAMALPLHHTPSLAIAAPEAAVAAADDDLDLRLLEQFRRQGDREALERLLLRHADAAYRVARRLSSIASDAQDAVQDGMLQVMTCAQQFRTPGSVRSWLLAVVANTCRRRERAERRRLWRDHAAAPADAAPVADTSLDDQERQAIRQELERMPAHYRLPISLRIIDDLTFAEIATILQRREKTVRSQVDRGLAKLREALQGKGLALSLTALVALHSDIAPPQGLTDHLRMTAREHPLPLPASTLVMGSGILIASGLLLAAAAVTLAVALAAHRPPAPGGSGMALVGSRSTTAPALQGSVPDALPAVAGSGAAKATATIPDPAVATSALSGVVAAIRPNAQGQQDLVILTIPAANTAEVGREFIIYRGAAYIVKVRVERALEAMLVCRVMPDTWNTRQLTISQGDSATIRIPTLVQPPPAAPVASHPPGAF